MSGWSAYGASQFTDKRSRLTRESGLVYQNVRAFRGVIARQGERGKRLFEHCPHAHNKRAAAIKCAEAAAKRKNKAEGEGS